MRRRLTSTVTVASAMVGALMLSGPAYADPQVRRGDIVDPHSSAGNLFDYGVWSVEREYCPR